MEQKSIHQPSLSVVIPFKDEVADLPQTLDTVFAYRDTHTFFEIILVDDGSRDGTVDAIHDYVSQPGVRLLTHEENRGKGAAVRTGVLAASGETILFSDADLSTPIEDLSILQAHIDSHDIVIGSRAMEESLITKPQRIHRVLIGRIGNLLIRFLLQLPYKDTQCGFKLFHREVAHELFDASTQEGWSFDFEILLLAQERGYTVKEVPVRWKNTAHSAFHPVRDSLKTFGALVTLFIQKKNARRS